MSLILYITYLLYKDLTLDQLSKINELIISLKKIVDVLGPDWVLQSLLPRLNEQLNKDNGYLFRVTSL